MSQVKRPVNTHKAYHAHVYFNGDTLGAASTLCGQAGELFCVDVGRVHEKLVGPHPRWSCQLAFTSAQFKELIPWLDRNRGELTVLVHGITGHDLADHTEHATWLGEAIPLDLSCFKS